MSSNGTHVTIAVDLAKKVFELAVANTAGRITERRRFSRAGRRCGSWSGESRVCRAR